MVIGLIILGIVLLVLVLLAILPVGVDGRYDQGTASLFLKCGPLRFQVVPWKRKSKPKKQKNKTAKQKKKAAAKSDQKPAPDSGKKDYRSLIRIVFRALQQFHRRMCMNLFMLHYTAASDDPYDTVMQYGRISAAVGALLPLAKQIFHIEKQDIILDLTFETEQPIWSARLVLTLRIWELFDISVRVGLDLLRWKKQQTSAENAKVEEPQPLAKQLAAVVE